VFPTASYISSGYDPGGFSPGSALDFEIIMWEIWMGTWETISKPDFDLSMIQPEIYMGVGPRAG
jgi:hypothetical protein